MKQDFIFRQTILTRCVLAACGAGAAVLAVQPVFAQTAAPALQRVEITGSNIKRADAETASPVQIITKEEIDRSGKGTVAEYLQTLTSDGQGSVPTTYGRGFAAGSSAGISLKGLGANATLVLVNGRRIAPAVLADDAQRSFVDLNMIPLEAVERVEILKDSASAIYGSDAVAGVVNIILKKSYVGTVAKLTYGRSSYSDGSQPRLAITHGFGDLEKDQYNVLLNFETGKKDAIYYRDRTDRGTVGLSALGSVGFSPGQPSNNNNVLRYGGIGVIPTNADGTLQNNTVVASIVGNVRNPTTLDYYSRSNPNGVGFTRNFPAAASYCANAANLPQNDPGKGCVTDLWRQFGEVQPDSKTNNFFGRFTKLIDAGTEAYAEMNLYKSDSRVQGGGTGVGFLPAGGYFQPDGTVVSQTAATVLGANHPDNPYFGTAARLSYNPILEIGPRVTSSSLQTSRVIAGLKGTFGAWDYDTALQFSQSKQTDTAEKTIDWRVKNALLNPTAANVAAAAAFSPAYAALPAGTFWRIGENAGLNSAAMYSALAVDQSRSGESRYSAIDLKASRELGKLDGGAIGLAVGAELRRESNSLPFFSGLGNYIGIPLTAYSGQRNVFAAYTEALFPVTKQLELNAALRFDKYSDVGNAVTPKMGAIWRPASNLALRGTYAEGFRAPSSTENSVTSLAGFGGASIIDKVRLNAGVPGQAAGVAPTFVQRGNPSLEPEKSQSVTLGMAWDITPKTSFTADLWQIRRKGLPVLEDPQQAVDAGRVVRDAATSTGPNDPGLILVGYVGFVNAATSKTQGLDLEAKHRFDLGGENGKLTLNGTWTHLFAQSVTDQDGTVHEYVGTHGNCQITNCMGTPRDRINFGATWDVGTWSFSGIVNYRGTMDNKFEAKDTTCAQTFANGTDAPSGCKISSFTTLDASFRWKVRPNTEVSGSIQNLLDRKPPFDPLTYGAVGYNPLDYSGAVGRYFTVGLRHKF